MTIAQIKEIYKNIYDICKKYNGTNHSHNKSGDCWSSDLKHTIKVDGSPYNFTTEILLENTEHEPPGFIDTYYVYIQIDCNDDGIHAEYDTDVDFNFGENDPDNSHHTAGESIDNAEIPEVIDFIGKLHAHLYSDNNVFCSFTTSSQPEDFEGWKLISELNNYLKSLK